MIAGSWNVAIFTPQFVAQRIMMGEGEIEAEVGLAPQGLLPRFSGSDFTLTVQPDRLVWRPRAATNHAFEQLERAAVSLLNVLSVTPISAVGINFGLDVDPGVGSLLDQVLNPPDSENLLISGAHQNSILVKRSLELDDVTLNFSVERGTQKSIGIELNFHKDVSGAENARRAIEGVVQRRKDQALQLLKSAYGFDLETA